MDPSKFSKSDWSWLMAFVLLQPPRAPGESKAKWCSMHIPPPCPALGTRCRMTPWNVQGEAPSAGSLFQIPPIRTARRTTFLPEALVTEGCIQKPLKLVSINHCHELLLLHIGRCAPAVANRSGYSSGCASQACVSLKNFGYDGVDRRQ